jgi:2-oxo-4-hydroxy-4-carboxy-5-ureidoimidazoline decarboxylase
MSRAIDHINRLDREAFVALLGPLYEHSPWAAERAFAKHPFSSIETLKALLVAVVEAASDDERMNLIRAHPELAGEKLSARALTASSMSEQATVGLDRLNPQEIESWTKYNAAYRERFGFPFIICVRLHDKPSIMTELLRRLGSTPEIEKKEAMRQIHAIAGIRLGDIVAKLEASA